MTVNARSTVGCERMCANPAVIPVSTLRTDSLGSGSRRPARAAGARTGSLRYLGGVEQRAGQGHDGVGAVAVPEHHPQRDRAAAADRSYHRPGGDRDRVGGDQPIRRDYDGGSAGRQRGQDEAVDRDHHERAQVERLAVHAGPQSAGDAHTSSARSRFAPTRTRCRDQRSRSTPANGPRNE